MPTNFIDFYRKQYSSNKNAVATIPFYITHFHTYYHYRRIVRSYSRILVCTVDAVLKASLEIEIEISNQKLLKIQIESANCDTAGKYLTTSIRLGARLGFDKYLKNSSIN
jgi:hypothetical protein